MAEIWRWVTPTVVCTFSQTAANGRYVSAKEIVDGIWLDPIVDNECFIWSGPNTTGHIYGPSYISGSQVGKTWSREDNTATSVWLGGTMITYTCSISYVVPATPEGYYLARAVLYENKADGNVNTISHHSNDPDFATNFPAGGIFTYQPAYMTGGSSNWHTLDQPIQGGNWGDSADIIPPYFTVPDAKFVYYSNDDNPDPDCVGIESGSITDEGAVLTGASATGWQWGTQGDNIGQESETGILTGLSPDTDYWFKALSYCEEKTFWFRTEALHEDDAYWDGVIITLPVTEVWASSLSQGATIHGMLKFPPRNHTKTFYLAIGFQLGISYDLTDFPYLWNRTGNFTAFAGTRATIYPIQLTTGGLLPDITYYYRACLHVGTPPMDENNHFGSTLSFGGPVSMFGIGWEYITAKKASDNISRLAVGRYYMDRSGIFQYESYQRRLT